MRTKFSRTLSLIVSVCMIFTVFPLEALAASLTAAAVEVCGSSITVSWEADESDESYILERREGESGTYVQIAELSQNSYTDSGLQLNTVYYYRYKVCTDGEWSSYSSGKYAKTDYLEQVSALTAVPAASGISLSWDTVDGADGYIVYYVDSEGAYTKLGQTAELTYIDSSISDSETRTYCVRAYYVESSLYRFGGYSQCVSSTADILGTPTDLTYCANGTAITVSWTAVSGADGYVVARREGESGDYEVIGSTENAEYEDEAPLTNTVYYYRVCAYLLTEDLSKDCGAYSAGKYTKTDYLDSVQGFGASVKSSGIQLYWDSVDGADGYIIYTVDDSGNNTKLCQISENTYLDASIADGEQRSYRLRAYCIEDEVYRFGGYSQILTVIGDILCAPAEITAEVNGRDVVVSWTESVGAHGYIVERKAGESGEYEIVAETTELEFEEELELLDSVYYYRVCPYTLDSDGEKDCGVYSASKYVKTAYLEIPESFCASVSGKNVSLSWSAAEGATGYIIYRCESQDGDFEKIAQTQELSFKQSGLAIDSAYYYRMRAYYDCGDSTYKFSGYTDVLEVLTPQILETYNVEDFGADGTDLSADNTAIQNALDLAKDIESVITVYVPEGTYYLDKTLYIYSDTVLELDENAIIIRNDDSQLMLVSKDETVADSETDEPNGGYGQFTNITVKGGIWDGNAGEDVLRSIFYFYHGQNLTIKNTQLKNCCGTHHIELVGVKNALVSGVEFKDFILCSQVDYSSIIKSDGTAGEDLSDYDGTNAEALQLDYCSEETSSGCQPYDYTACADITVTDCVFQNVLNGVGNHHNDAVTTNVVISNNTFSDIKNSCTNLFAVSGYTLSDNQAEDVRKFLTVYGSDGTVCGNTVTTGVSDDKAAASVIYAEKMTQSLVTVPDSSIKLENNAFYNYSAADDETTVVHIYLGNTTFEITSNIFEGGIGSAIRFDSCVGDFSKNTVYDSNLNGIVFDGSCDVTMSGNEIYSCNGAGIIVTDGTISMSGDSIYKNAGDGVNLNAANASLSNVSLLSNAKNGVQLLNGASADISDSVISENSLKGAAVYSASSLSVTSTEISSNTEDGIGVYGGSQAYAEGCDIHNNGCNGINVSASYAELIANRVTLSGTADGYYDIAFKKDSSGSAAENITDSLGVRCFDTDDVELTDNQITLENDYSIDIPLTIYYANGEAIEPQVTVGDLSADTDFDVVYSDNYDVGTALITVTGKGSYADSLTAQFEIRTAQLAAPTLSYSIISGRTVEITAASEEDCDGYVLLRRAEGESKYSLAAQSSDASFTQVLDYNCSYQYLVTVYKNDGDNYYESAYSEPLSVQVNLAAPQTPVVSPSGANVTVSWSEAEGAWSYIVERRLGTDSQFEQIAQVEDTSYTDTGLELAAVYYYRVRAYADECYSDYSPAKYAKTDYLDRVSGVTAQCVGEKATLTWEAVSGADGYMIYTPNADGTYTKLAQVTALSYTANVTIGNTYNFVVKAYYKDDTSTYRFGGYSDIVTLNAQSLESPNNLTASVSDSSVVLSWDAVDGAQKYIVEKRLESAADFEVAAQVETTSFTDTALSLETVYYRVKACTDSCYGDYSDECSLIACDVTLSSTQYTFTGKAITPTPTVKIGASTIDSTNYTVTYTNNISAGTATVTLSGKNNLTGTVTKTFQIVQKPLSYCTVTLPASQYTFNGKAITPTPTVKIGASTIDSTNYTVTYTNNISAGTATVTLSGKNNLTGTVTKTFQIVQKSLSYCTVTLPASQYTFTGKAITPTPTVKIGDITIYSGNYTVTYANNISAGTATVTLSGKNNLTGTVTKTFKIVQKSLSYCTVTLPASQYTFTGKAITPTPTVKIGDVTIYSGNYTVTYTNNISAGTATVTLSGKNNLTGTVTKTFKIVQKSLSYCTVTLTENSANKYQPTVTVKIGDVVIYNGNYTVSYTTSSDKKTVTVKLTGKNNLTSTVTKTYTVTDD